MNVGMPFAIKKHIPVVMLPLDVFHSMPYLSVESLVVLVTAISILGLRFFLEYRVALSSIKYVPNSLSTVQGDIRPVP